MSVVTLDTEVVRRWKRYREYQDGNRIWFCRLPATWQSRKLKSLLSANDGGVWGEDFDENGTIVLRSTDVTIGGGWDLTNPASRRLTHNEIRNACLRAEDLLVTKSSGSELHLGKTALVTQDIEDLGCCFSNFMQRLRTESALMPKFLWWFLNSSPGREQLLFNGTTTTGLANLGGRVIGDTILPLPSIPEQQAIAAFLDRETARIDALIERKERLIALLEEKRQAVISHAVTRGLDPSVPMKDSGVEWLGMVPEHWRVTVAKRVCQIFVPERSKPDINNDHDGLPWITPEDIGKPTVSASVSNRWVSEEAMTRNGSRSLSSGSVVASCVGRFALASINKVPCIINQQLQAYVPRRINPFFLRFLIMISEAYFGQNATVTTLAYVNQEKFGEMPVLLPPSVEQVGIVNWLDNRMPRIDTLEKQINDGIDRLQEYRTALISAAVTGQIDVRDEVTS
ncbi:MAG: restriction endonuclease subunit S [Gemmataceae bacterium]